MGCRFLHGDRTAWVPRRIAEELSLDAANAAAVEVGEDAELAERDHVLLAPESGDHAG